jgi:hypothetical protein
MNVPKAACSTSIKEAVWIHRAWGSVALKSCVLLLRAFEMALKNTDAQRDAKRML